MRNKVLWLLALVLLAACSSSTGERDRRTGPNGEPTPIPTSVVASRPTFQVARGEVVYGIEFSGRIAPVTEQALTFVVDGDVKEVLVTRGQHVLAGEQLAVLETADWEGERVLAQAALEIAQAQLVSSQRGLEVARQEAELRRDLAQLDLVFAQDQAGDIPSPEQQYEIDRLALLLRLAQLQLDALDSGVDPQLQADVDAAALAVAELDSLIAKTTLEAPFDGEITAINLIPGRSVKMGEAVGIIADPTQIEVSASLRDAQLGDLSEGMAVQIVPAGSPGEPLAGMIRRLPYPYGSGGQAAFDEEDQVVRIQFDDMDAALSRYEPSDRVRLSVEVARRENVLWLPPAAIRDFNGRKFVVLQLAGGQQRQDVRLGIEGGGRVEVLEGVEAGQTIVGQ